MNWNHVFFSDFISHSEVFRVPERAYETRAKAIRREQFFAQDHLTVNKYAGDFYSRRSSRSFEQMDNSGPNMEKFTNNISVCEQIVFTLFCLTQSLLFKDRICFVVHNLSLFLTRLCSPLLAILFASIVFSPSYRPHFHPIRLLLNSYPSYVWLFELYRLFSMRSSVFL